MIDSGLIWLTIGMHIFLSDLPHLENFRFEMLHISRSFTLAKQVRKRGSAVQPPEQFTHFI